MFYNYFRDYDPALGRYVTADPIGILRDYDDPQLRLAIKAGLPIQNAYLGNALNHLYGYVDQNPFSYMDPLGLKALPGLGGAGASAMGLGADALNNYYLNPRPGDFEDIFYCAWAHCPDDNDQSCDRDDYIEGSEWAGSSAPAPWKLPKGCICLVWGRR